jgi:hypothetical protein
MASETNELTFVRCPTCRSLVPASASKCRICNGALDAAAKGAAGDAPASPGGRVRQKTVSAGAEDVRSMVTAGTPSAASGHPPAAAAAPPKAPVPPASAAPMGDDSFDPLGAFLQDLDSSGDKAPQSPEVNVKKPDAAPVDLFDGGSNSGDDSDQDDDLDDFDLDIFDDPSFDDPILDNAAAESPKQVEEVLAEEAEPFSDIDDGDSEFEAQPEAPKPAPIAPRREPPREEVPRQDPPRQEFQRRDVPRQQETRKPQNRDPQPAATQESSVAQAPSQARSAQSQIRPRIGGMPHRPEPKPQISTNEQVSEGPKAAASRVAETREKPVRAVPAPQPAVQPKPEPVIAGGRGRPETAPPRQQVRPAAEKPVQVAEEEGVRPSKMRAGRLFGWLVSYEHPDGRAIELRAGRFFISGASIRPTDLILEDQSISTPHALMSITENGLQLQDLMSERGTFVRCQGEAQYTREDGVVEVRHGDWIRFGDVEFLVTVVPA